MSFNVGTPDRVVRVILGLLLLIVPFATSWTLFDSPFWVWVSVIAGFVLIVTGVVRFCPAYRILGMSTAKKDR